VRRRYDAGEGHDPVEVDALSLFSDLERFGAAGAGRLLGQPAAAGAVTDGDKVPPVLFYKGMDGLSLGEGSQREPPSLAKEFLTRQARERGEDTTTLPARVLPEEEEKEEAEEDVHRMRSTRGGGAAPDRAPRCDGDKPPLAARSGSDRAALDTRLDGALSTPNHRSEGLCERRRKSADLDAFYHAVKREVDTVQAVDQAHSSHIQTMAMMHMGQLQRFLYTLLNAAALVFRFGARPLQIVAARVLRLVAVVSTGAPSTL